MKLHIFNPEHDLVLAANKLPFTPSHSVRQLKSDLGFIPVFLANNGDAVLVDNVEATYTKLKHFKLQLPDVQFVTSDNLPDLAQQVDSISCWGIDNAICSDLRKYGFDKCLPSQSQLSAIREMSSRRWVGANLLPELCNLNVNYAQTYQEVTKFLKFYGRMVVKAPWSSSGRGVRYITSALLDLSTQNWIKHIIAQQGGIMIEPFYHKIADFGMESTCDGKGNVQYCGLSIFNTKKAAYTGNQITSEDEKLRMLASYVNDADLRNIRNSIIQLMGPFTRQTYKGYFGVDMMVYYDEDSSKCLINPCIELNLRQTMGHVALALYKEGEYSNHVMHIYYSSNGYHMSIMQK